MRPPSPTRSPETGSRCLPRRRASRSLHRRGLARAACPQPIFISLCTNLRARREGEAIGRTDLGRVTTRPGSRLDRRRDLLFSVSVRGHPCASRRCHPDHRPWRQVTKAPPTMYPGYPPGYAYSPYMPPPPAQPALTSASAAGPPPAAGTGRFCTSCGSPVANGNSFCPNCGIRLAP